MEGTEVLCSYYHRIKKCEKYKLQVWPVVIWICLPGRETSELLKTASCRLVRRVWEFELPWRSLRLTVEKPRTKGQHLKSDQGCTQR